MKVPGRLFPIEIYYSENPVKDYVKSSIEAILNVKKKKKVDSCNRRRWRYTGISNR